MREPFIFLCPEITRENALTLIQWLKDDEVRKYLSDGHNVSASISEVVNRVNLPVLTHLFSRNGRFYMAYDMKKVPVGFVRLVEKGSQLEMVVVIGNRNNWGKKLGSSTIRESMKIAFFELRTQKLIAKIHKENVRSLRAFMNAGFKIEYEVSTLKSLAITMDEYLKMIQGVPVMSTNIYITEIDKNRLKKLIDDEFNSGKAPDKNLQELESELNKAVVVSPKQLPGRIISMNTRALLDLNDDDIEVSLVYPKDADWSSNKLSVLSPIGTAILGYGEGDKIEWKVPSGVTEIRIKKILYQPEAAGDYHL